MEVRGWGSFCAHLSHLLHVRFNYIFTWTKLNGLENRKNSYKKSLKIGFLKNAFRRPVFVARLPNPKQVCV